MHLAPPSPLPVGHACCRCIYQHLPHTTMLALLTLRRRDTLSANPALTLALTAPTVPACDRPPFPHPTAQLHQYLPHLFLNETEPVDLGHAYVGDRKEFAKIALDTSGASGSFTVKGALNSHWDPNHTGATATGRWPGQTILDASWNTTGNYKNASKFPELSLHG